VAELPIRTFGDPVLRERCPEVKEIDDSVRKLVKDLVDSLPRPGGAGLSANQIGILKRVFVFDDDGEITACVNPRILEASEEMVEELEGCLSLPEAVVPVPRHASLELEFLDLEGRTHRVRAEGWKARVFQHEIDHLEGKLILDRTDRESRVEALRVLQEGAGREA